MKKASTNLKYQSSKERNSSMSRGETNNFSHCAILPPENIADILSRLPVKSLCRFKCVSPSWNSLISSPYFAQTHLNRTNANNPKHLDRNIILISTTDDLYSVNVTADIPFATKIDFPNSLQQPENKWGDVLGSCNGLLLASNKGNSNFFLLNPSTRECKKLPPLPFGLDPVRGFHLYGYGLGYDSSKDDYKVVMLSFYDAESVSVSESESSTLSGITTVAVYSHKTNAWRRIQDTHYVLDVTSSGVYCNGCLHWLCWRDGLYVMVAFDWADEIFREVPLPASFVHNEFAYYRVLIVGDYLCLVDKRSSIVWMMKEYGVRASWTKIMICIRNMRLLCVLGLFAEEEFVLKIKGKIVQRLDKDILVVYNPKQGMLRDIVVRGIPTEFRFGGTYVESLVPPHLCNHGGGIGKQGQAFFS